jgi:PhzF family phenazine biosynthesis protein
MKHFHVDVFSERPLSGNGLSVVFPDRELDAATLLGIAQEFKQFETSFVYPPQGGRNPTRIFTVQEELAFAGHPVLGVAAVLHSLYHPKDEEADITVGLAERNVNLRSARQGEAYEVRMDQGRPDFIREIDDSARAEICSWVGVGPGPAPLGLPLAVVSTGLPYLLIPVTEGLDRARIAVGDLERRLSAYGAKFLYLFDPKTGSAAGPLISYLVKKGRARPGEEVRLSQGKWLGRPSLIRGSVDDQGRVSIRGAVSIVATGELRI